MYKCGKCGGNMIARNTYNKDDHIIRRRVCNRCGSVILTREVEEVAEIGKEEIKQDREKEERGA